MSPDTWLTSRSMTWAGKQGFQSAPVFQSFKVDGMKAPMGNVHAERGLAYYEVVLSGHMIPQFSPWVRRRAARVGPAMRGADACGAERVPGDAVPHWPARHALSAARVVATRRRRVCHN
jgi:hypothetical protein